MCFQTNNKVTELETKDVNKFVKDTIKIGGSLRKKWFLYHQENCDKNDVLESTGNITKFEITNRFTNYIGFCKMPVLTSLFLKFSFF